MTEKPLAAMTPGGLDNFNKDLNSIAAAFGGETIRAILAKNQNEALILARNVMYRAAAPYLGAFANGTEIIMRLLCPVDLASTIEEYWDLDLSGEAIGDIWGFQTGGTTPANDTMGEYEGNIVMAFLDRTPQAGFAKYQLLKGGKTYGYFPLTFTADRDDALPVSPLMAPFLEFPLESVRIQCDVRKLINPTVMQAIGLHFCRASSITTATGSA
jgi:hypothetical protein